MRADPTDAERRSRLFDHLEGIPGESGDARWPLGTPYFR